MKHKLTYLILLLCCGGLLYSQTYFSRVHRNWESYSQLLALDSGYVTVVQDYELPKNGLIIREYDLLGDVVDSAYYLFNEAPESIPNCLFKIPSGSNFIYASGLGLKSLLVKFNRQWDTVQTRIYRYQDSLGAQPYKIIPDTDSTFLMTGRTFDSASQKLNILFTRMDTSFNPIWEKHYSLDTSSLPGGFQGFDVLPLNDAYLLGGVAYYPGGQHPNRGIIVKTDLNGNFIWQREITSPKGTGAVQLGKRSDGNFFFFAPEIIDTSYQGFSRPMRLRFGIFDSHGNILKDKMISPLLDDFNTLVYTPTFDGAFLVGGSLRRSQGYQSFLFKFSENGDSIWSRFHWFGYPDAWSELEDIAITPDSGFILSGNFLDLKNLLTPFGKLHVYTWLLKLDQYGCDTAGCERISLPEPVIYQAPLKVYPNPTRGYLVLEWEELQEKATVKVFNNTGQLVYENQYIEVWQKYISTESWPVGIYHLQIDSGKYRQSVKILKE
ncbi:MAG: T9SS type A sorting domain-containing protein [Owenweeksia sp.]